MKKLLLLALLSLPAPVLAQQAECRVLVAKEWIEMGATSLSGCFRFADEAATPGERQFAKLGDYFLKVEGELHFASADGGNTWDVIALDQPAAAFGSLNVLQPSSERASVAPAETGARPAPVKSKKKKKRRRRSTSQH